MRFVYLMLIDLKLFMSMRIYVDSTYASPVLKLGQTEPSFMER